MPVPASSLKRRRPPSAKRRQVVEVDGVATEPGRQAGIAADRLGEAGQRGVAVTGLGGARRTDAADLALELADGVLLERRSTL